MSEEAVILHGAPTLAGIKTGSLFRCEYESIEAMRASLREWNRRFSGRGLRVVPLTFENNKALLYLYRPQRLSRDLSDGAASRILSDCGYCEGSPERCLSCLAKRIRSNGDFPHEIGLFLGYPPEDVTGFIEHRECDLKCVGCWKVYGDAAKAQKTFRLFRRCSELYRQRFQNGTPIERLTVAEHTGSGRE
ncbi:MAG: DUF3793 family protein [Clostridia bacterium]|nr:DUF3793 family protein [Clostridia bacterium]